METKTNGDTEHVCSKDETRQKIFHDRCDESADSFPPKLKENGFSEKVSIKKTLKKTSSLMEFSTNIAVKSGRNMRKVLVIYTGGTIGMVKNREGALAPQKNIFETLMRTFPQLHDNAEWRTCVSEPGFDPSFFVLPKSEDTGLTTRIVYKIMEYETLLDSSNVSEREWMKIASDIMENYEEYDGFVVLHGTDTLSYTASALSFLFENLGKAVVLTGSQIPIFEPRSDGADNFVSSLIIAGHLNIPEVTIFFGSKLLRGNRTRKLSADHLSAFESPNFPPLVEVGIDFKVHTREVFKPTVIDKCRLHSAMSNNVGLLRIFPSVSRAVFKAFCQPPLEGVVSGGLTHCEAPGGRSLRGPLSFVNKYGSSFGIKAPLDSPHLVEKYVESSLGWAGERGEDSSYDSECDDDGGHRAASRTPSDTLAAEFAEYVTLSAPQPNQAKIEFAVKLGYSERLARTALQRLGPDPPCNELLAELIKLAAKQPPRALSPPPPAEPDPPPDRAPLRHIVIDGSNVAMSHGNKELFSCRGIEICVDWFRARGHKEITVFIPKWRKEASRPDNPVADRDALERLERDRVLVYTPSRLLGGKRLVCYDDRYILRLAAETDGIVVSNDNYRDLAAESPEFRKVVEERLLMYSFVNDRFMPPDDPLGRSGPTLDAFLRAPPSRTDPPPACPYGRKCTYGNKCKFHHPERAGRPHKSVAEKLSERAARALRQRDLHTVSLPPGGRPVDNKKPLARAHSAAPRLADPALTTHFDRAQIAGPSQPPAPSMPEANPHRKLARQLTLNPACDPRLHAAAARVASAPVGAAAGPLTINVSPCSSEGALQHWEARRRMHFHLAGIFPEAQVAEAMAAYPDEVDAQKMCAIILARYRPSEAPLPPLPPRPH